MKVVILCGGTGTRLREETEFKPKPMVYVGDKPILWHIMKIYASYGFNDFVLALGYKGEIIKEYFNNYELMSNDVTLELGKPENRIVHQNHKEVGWRITLVDTGQDTLKGARLKKIEKYIDGEEFMVTYGDGVGDVNIPSLIKFHKNHKKMVTVTGVIPTMSRFGKLTIQRNNVARFDEKPPSESFINGGFFVFNKAIFNHLSEKDSCDLEAGPLEKLSQKKQVMVYRHNGFWSPMDTFRDTLYLNKLWNEGKAAWKIW